MWLQSKGNGCHIDHVPMRTPIFQPRQSETLFFPLKEHAYSLLLCCVSGGLVQAWGRQAAGS